MMPGESGLSLTKFIKKNNPMPINPVPATGNTSDRIEGLEVGADEYLGKPFEPKELLLRIKKEAAARSLAISKSSSRAMGKVDNRHQTMGSIDR